MNALEGDWAVTHHVYPVIDQSPAVGVKLENIDVLRVGLLDSIVG